MKKAPKDVTRGNRASASAKRTDVLSFIESGQITSTADYISRGRQHQDLSDDELSKLWKAAYVALADNPFSEAFRAMSTDLGAEFELRRLPLPDDPDVADAVERYTSAVAEALRKMKLDEPERFAEANDELERDIDIFKAQKDGSSN